MQDTSPSAPIPPLILVIDDSPTVCALIALHLTRRGVGVKSFGDPVEALRWLYQQQETLLPDAILLDLHLPKMDGYQVIAALKKHERLCQISIVVMSADTGDLERVKRRLAGASTSLEKPFTIQRLLAVVQQCLQRQPEGGRDDR